ncbi:MAG: transporter substrate-binding domain-containing protein [Gammaproteobacteria bacterium]|nr:transporter substrate-binding domain-containing protein [Gammaproteobacteria bacterium]
MKKLQLFSFLFFSFFTLQAQAQTISIVANTWPPYVDKALDGEGLAMKIVKAAFKHSGHTSKIIIEPWSKALNGLHIGAYDVVGAIWKTEERKKELLYSQPYLTNNIVLITNVNSQITFDSLKDLQGLVVGVLKGYEYDDKFMNDPKILKFQANRLTQNLIAIQNGKLDVAIADKRLALYELKNFMGSNSNHFQFLPKRLNSRKLYLATTKGNPKNKVIIEQFNKGLQAIKKNGTYQTILDEFSY